MGDFRYRQLSHEYSPYCLNPLVSKSSTGISNEVPSFFYVWWCFLARVASGCALESIF